MYKSAAAVYCGICRIGRIPTSFGGGRFVHERGWFACMTAIHCFRKLVRCELACATHACRCIEIACMMDPGPAMVKRTLFGMS